MAKTLSDVDVLYAYGNFSPAIINAFIGKTVYMVRDEYGLGWNINYYQGIRGLIQSLYHACEWPLYLLWRHELISSIRKSRLIANSEFIRQKLADLAPGKEVEVIFPQVDVVQLQNDYYEFKGKVGIPGIIIIGDNDLKGSNIARKVAARFPEIQFYIFDRLHYEIKQENNVILMPWSSPGYVYAHAKLVMVPSRWHEAYPRVVLEARILDLPVVASRRGGIPEALRDLPEGLVNNIDDIDEWAQKIIHFMEISK